MKFNSYANSLMQLIAHFGQHRHMTSLRQDTPDEKPPGHPRTPHRTSVDAEVKQDNHGRDLSGGASQHFGGISTAWTSVTGDSVTGGMYSEIKTNFIISATNRNH